MQRLPWLFGKFLFARLAFGIIFLTGIISVVTLNISTRDPLVTSVLTPANSVYPQSATALSNGVFVHRHSHPKSTIE